MLARAEEPYPLATPQPGWAEQDPRTGGVLPRRRSPRSGRRRRGIGLSGGCRLVALDDADRVLRPAILWNDQRTGEECAEIEERFGLRELVRLTGNRALPGFTAPKLLWLRKHEPDVYARIGHVLLPKDYVRLRLTGEHATDVADASGTLLFDVAARGWSDEVMDEARDPARVGSHALESPAASGQTGSGVPVAAGAGDQAAGALGVGVEGPARSPSCSDLGRRLRGAPRLRCRSGRTRTRLLPRRARWMARDGRDAFRGGFARLAARRRRAGQAARRWSPKPSRGLPVSRGSFSSRISPASARRTSTPMPEPPSPASRSATTAVRSSAPCWKGWRSNSATPSSSCAPRRRAPVRQVSGGGARSDLWRRDRRFASRVAAGAHRGRGRRCVRRGAPRRGRRGRLRRRPRGRRRDRAGS